MSGDLNMYASGSGDGQKSGWRKRTIMEMAREAWADDGTEGEWDECCLGLARAIRARGDKHD